MFFFFHLPSADLQPNTLPYNAAAVAAAMNLSPIVLQQKGLIPEQCEALNLGKKCQGTNNNNAGENDDEPTAKRIKAEHSPGGANENKESPKMKSPSPVRNSISPGRISADENENDDHSSNIIEMDIDVSAGKNLIILCTIR